MLTRSTAAQHGLGKHDFRAGVDNIVYVHKVQRHFSEEIIGFPCIFRPSIAEWTRFRLSLTSN